MNKKKRLDYLDSMRGLAAIAVAIFHYFLFYKEEIISNSNWELENNILYSFINTIDLGKIAVLVFFMISGFVIPYSIKKSGNEAVKQFAISRFFRLYPVYWVSVFFGVILYNISWKVGLINLTMLQQFIGVPNVIGLYWTLQLELFFYFLMIILIILKKNDNQRVGFLLSLSFLLLAIIMAVFRFYLQVKFPVAFPLSLSVMFFGSYWRSFILNKDLEAKKNAFIYIVIYIAVIPIISKLAYNIDFGFSENWIKYVISYYSAMFIFLSGTLIKYSNNFFVFLGKISYSVYLFHPITYKVFGDFVNDSALRVGWKIMIHLLILILFSFITYSVIEKFSIKLGREIKSTFRDELI